MQKNKDLKKYIAFMTFSSDLREILDMREMQIKVLASKTSISKNTLDNYLSGQKSLPNARNVVKLLMHLMFLLNF